MNVEMNIISAVGGKPLTMSSREIAELCGKRHDNVMRDIRTTLNDLGGLLNFEGTYFDAQGKEQKCFNLPKRETLIVVSGYSIELRARIIDRWMELEQGVSKSPGIDFSDPRMLLGVLTHLQGEVAKKNEVIAEQGTRLKKLDRLEGATGSMCISDAAKTLGVGRDYLFQFLSSRKWIFKRAGNKNWLAYDAIRKAGHLEHDDHLYMDDLGRERVSTRVLVTAKGLVRIAELLEQPLH
ncbi:phage regulatory protein/antirepressor Ant [Neorhizobium sp. CSC1952]|uniref:Rha family transcriptional regulator n=1 Tax=Neorhizobium sp. CSC1952 TaxID=2978974 RepID=UPI0025A51932|nr:phage regulatory protein/antirepressor Ant [Rhizobium sp. CSC1952]WJR66942.1 phage regulatory protein/antirepressor Ant [Rhizobium sp. CSC1952]